MTPAVSVIIPVYKVEKYIERCARALFSQTLESIELIFVDDCSPDASMEILSRVLEDFPDRINQVKILHNEVNRGLPFTRKRGVGVASGDYIIHCDSDDWVEKDWCEKLWRKANSSDADVAICGFLMEDGARQRKSVLFGEEACRDILSGILTNRIHGSLCVKLIKRDVYKHILLWPDNNMWEDKALSLQLLFFSRKTVFLQEPLYHYCLNQSGISLSRQVEPKLSQLEANVALIVSFLDEKGLTEKYRWEISAMKAEVQMYALALPRKQYLAVYPENHLRQLLNPYVSFARKAGHLTKLLGIHGISGVFHRK